MSSMSHVVYINLLLTNGKHLCDVTNIISDKYLVNGHMTGIIILTLSTLIELFLSFPITYLKPSQMSSLNNLEKIRFKVILQMAIFRVISIN
ncbi:CLUMA_CG014998, isoform A [Clunio marinus]|uniref:CLUMA_CG014998, isoform A n=1 Tax=Clunio marinus TaxID=568069 RepID=A0A1J1IRR8_9DIPT|nr:CLUMA_CG014998, isoform A [Clunio marinus]